MRRLKRDGLPLRAIERRLVGLAGDGKLSVKNPNQTTAV
jgi:hypothetical protein